MCGLNIKKILVPLDGSQNSYRGLEEAIYLARSCKASITGLYVIGLVLPSKNAPLSSVERFLLEQAAKFMARAKKHAAKHGILFFDKVLYGYEGQQIVSYAKKNNFDIIIVGSRGRSVAKEVFLGSTSNYVLHKSAIPVLIVK